MKPELKSMMEMTAQTVGKDLLSALVQEVRLMPDVWVKLSQKKQDDVIDRIRSRVEANVKMALHLLASEGRTVVTGDLDQITIKDGVKAVVKFGINAPNLHELYDAAGKAVLLVVANPQDHMGGMDEIKGESDQRAMDLGQEYDPNGDGKGMGEEGVVDAEFKEMPQLGHEPSGDEQAGTYGDSSDIPQILKSKSGHLPNEHGVYTCDPDQTIRFEAKGMRLTWELLELENGQWIYCRTIQIQDSYSGSPMMATDIFPSISAVKEDIAQWLNINSEQGMFLNLSVKETKRFAEFMHELNEQEDQSNTAEA